MQVKIKIYLDKRCIVSYIYQRKVSTDSLKKDLRKRKVTRSALGEVDVRES